MIQTEQVTFRNIYVCTYTYVHEITISFLKQEAIDLMENGEGIWKGLEGGNRREKCLIKL